MELKPCPWCGQKHEPYDGDYHFAKCYKAEVIALRARVTELEGASKKLFDLIYEHGTPVLKAHATELLGIKKILWDWD